MRQLLFVAFVVLANPLTGFAQQPPHPRVTNSAWEHLQKETARSQDVADLAKMIALFERSIEAPLSETDQNLLITLINKKPKRSLGVDGDVYATRFASLILHFDNMMRQKRNETQAIRTELQDLRREQDKKISELAAQFTAYKATETKHRDSD